MNPFPYTFDNKRYHTLAYHNRVQNCKTQKAVIDAGLSCPNIDGTCGVGGCIFCDGGSGYFTQDKAFSVTEQLQAEKVRIHKKSPESKIIAYFQVMIMEVVLCRHMNCQKKKKKKKTKKNAEEIANC